ncbi:PP2C family protein-serine/threonine phosphatase [Candidatus Mycosynbacter amalyticus]|nr:protein phosphatase 2C domain-containing protein [Candidatus Mycosynbacter amalyticus]
MTRQNEGFNNFDDISPNNPEWNHARSIRIPDFILRQRPHPNKHVPTQGHITPPTSHVQNQEIVSSPRFDQPVESLDLSNLREHYAIHTKLFGTTEQSLRKHSSDDYIFMDAENNAAGVFDGVGSAVKADEAAYAAGAAAKKALARDHVLTEKRAANLMRDALFAAHEVVCDMDATVPAGREAPATTGTIAQVFRNFDGDQYVAVASVGDSRAYIHSPSHDYFSCITTDQTPSRLPQDALRARQSRLDHVERRDDYDTLSPEDKRAWQTRNIIGSALGSERVIPQIILHKVSPGDRIVLTTDGVHDNLSAQQMRQYIGGSDAAAIPKSLIMSAQDMEDSFRGKPDDMSCVVIEVQ